MRSKQEKLEWLQYNDQIVYDPLAVGEPKVAWTAKLVTTRVGTLSTGKTWKMVNTNGDKFTSGSGLGTGSVLNGTTLDNTQWTAGILQLDS